LHHLSQPVILLFFKNYNWADLIDGMSLKDQGRMEATDQIDDGPLPAAD
jgi:hypothetical protein